MLRDVYAVRALALAGLFAGACSLLVPDDDEYVGGNNPDDGGTSGGAAGRGGSDAGSAGAVSSGGSSATGGTAGAKGGAGGAATGGTGGGCTPEAGQLAQSASAIYLMLDRTSSMSAEWSAVENGIGNFLQMGDGEIALEYFPPPGMQAADCTGSEFATPEIAMAPVALNANPIQASLATESPQIGSTALQGVLIGGLAYARDYAVAHPELQVSLALLTDFAGTDVCSTQAFVLSGIAQSAAQSDPPVRTYIGTFENADTQTLDQIAAAGGTIGSEWLSSASDVYQFLRRTALSCRFVLPQGTSLSGTVSATLTIGAQQIPLQQVASPALCGGNGSEFFVSGSPAAALGLCPAICAQLSLGAATTIDFQTQCP